MLRRVVQPNIKMITDKGTATLIGRCAIRGCGERATTALDIGEHKDVKSWPRRTLEGVEMTVLTCEKHGEEWEETWTSREQSNRLRELCDLPEKYRD